MADPATPDILTLTARIVAAHVAGKPGRKRFAQQSMRVGRRQSGK